MCDRRTRGERRASRSGASVSRAGLNVLTVLPVITMLGPSVEALACGPDFQVEHLTRRAETLLAAPEGVFFDEVERLVVPPFPYPVVEGPEPEGARDRALPGERHLYERGAAAYRAGRHDEAAAAFRELLALPPVERPSRSTWAAYMLGKLEPPGNAKASFRYVRELVRAGFSDELGLATASLGEEARLHLDVLDDVAAVNLYAEQAALGASAGSTSLLLVVRDVLADPQRTEWLLDDEMGQRLIAAYLYTRPREVTDARLDEVLRLAEARVATAGDGPGLAGADRLAAAAYRRGQWGLAERLAHLDADTVLSRRVQAKLALRRGERDHAAFLLAIADAACDAPSPPPATPAASPAEGPVPRAMPELHVERGTLFMASGAYEQALMELLAEDADRLSVDAVFAAERVLTSDELGRLLDAHALPHEEPLSSLLARRLMREGRYAEALPRFPDEGDRERAARYHRALLAADDERDPVRRAAHLFEAATLAREHGLSVLATTHEPDWAYYDARYAPDVVPPGLPDPDGPFTTPDELLRRNESAPHPSERFHYRFVAADLAEGAAGLVPPRSQAFAALLCHAARYVRNRDEDRRLALWKRYVRQGPLVDFAGTFGDVCPAPDFAGAAKRRSGLAWGTLQLAAVSGIGFLVVVVALARRARRWRAVV